jgi:hypothetical protein
MGPNAPELHNLHWEKLLDPQHGTPLLTSGDIFVSRYLSSLDWSPVRLRRKGDLRALVVVANPDLSAYPQLFSVDVVGELERAASNLSSITMTVLASGGIPTLAPAGVASLGNVVRHLRKGYDILYLVCHGTLGEGGPVLWLEDEAGQAELVSGNELVTRLRELSTLPRLVVLASCQSAGQGNGAHSGVGGALSALGPRLAEAGVPAMLAMQGNISMGTIAEFMPLFFQELQADGQVDRAVAVARGAVRDRPDWWMPALFMRLKTGTRPVLVRHSRTSASGGRCSPASTRDGARPSLGRTLPNPSLGPGARSPVAWLKDTVSRWRRTAGRIYPR